MNYLNKALDIFNTAVVTPIYYVMFTTFTIMASVILFQEWYGQTPSQILSEILGFGTIISGVFLLHRTRDPAALAHLEPGYTRLQTRGDDDGDDIELATGDMGIISGSGGGSSVTGADLRGS